MPAPIDTHSDAELAAHLAVRAGEHLLTLRQRGYSDVRGLRDEGDASSNRLLLAALAEQRPEDAILSEESPDSRARLQADRVWIVDPLDGTREYGEVGRTDWAVHVALWERRADGLTAGAVAVPAEGLVFATDRPLPQPEPPPPMPRLAVSRSRATERVLSLADALGAELVPLGSAGVKTMAVVRGQADAYVHEGPMYEWDAAAPAAVAAAAGLHVSRFDGEPLQFNTPAAQVTQLVVAHPAIADRVLAALGDG